MHTPVLVLDALALLCAAAALGAGFVLYGTWKTRVLLYYMVFISTITAFAGAMALLSVTDALWQAGVAAGRSPVLVAFSVLLQAVGGIVHVAILPHFVYAINNRHPSDAVQRAFLAVAALMGVLAVGFVVRPGVAWIGYVLTGMLFASISWCIARMVVWLLRKETVPRELDTSRSLRSFVWVSLAFLPLFILDVLVSQHSVSPVLAWFDGISVPAYLMVLAVGSMVFARGRLAMPPLYRDEQLTEYCRKRYSLTGREAEVVEYVMEGYSVPDLASVLQISAKTAENHLYSAYQKLSVSNRIQLFQTLMSHR